MWGKKQTFTQCVSNDGRRTQMQTQERENQNKTQSWLNSFSTTDHTATQHIFFLPEESLGFQKFARPPCLGTPCSACTGGYLDCTTIINPEDLFTESDGWGQSVSYADEFREVQYEGFW